MKRDENKRRLGRAEKIVLALMALAVMFTLGFFAGRSSRSGGAMTVQAQKSPETSASQTQDTGQAAESASETTADESASPDALINVNTATAAELETLPGIGEVMAQRIIEFRETYGDFILTDEITDVSGIGEATFENIKDLITVGDAAGGS